MEHGLGTLGQLEWSMSLCEPSISEQLSLSTLSADDNSSVLHSVDSEIVMFSDDVGKDLDQLINSQLGQSVINYCYPGSNYNNIIENVCRYNFNGTENLILFIANRGTVNKVSLQQYFEKLKCLNVRKIFMFTLPYCNRLPQEENYDRYRLNMTLTHLSRPTHTWDLRI
jgi:hypothetical protein